MSFVYTCMYAPQPMCNRRVFPGGDWGSPIRRKFCQSPPHQHLSPFLDQGLFPPAEVRPRKFEKFKYILVSNLTIFMLKSTIKSCSSCLTKKWPNFASSGQFWLQSDFFASPPPHPTSSLLGTDGDRKF